MTNRKSSLKSPESGRRIRRLAGIVSATPDAIISIDMDHTIRFANPAACQMFRCPLEDMMGTLIDRFIPKRFRKSHVGHIQAFATSGVTTRKMAGHLAVTGLRADGNEFPLEASISQIEADGEPVLTVILRDITLRLQAEEELSYMRTQLRMLTARQRNLHEDEQKHISRELHDDIGQRLSALKMDIASLKGLLPSDRPELFNTVEDMDELLSSTILAVRTLASGLRPKILDDLGLAPALETFLHEIEHRFDLTCHLEIDDNLSISQEESIALFRIIQEAVNNVAKHAQATTVDVVVQIVDQHLCLTVADNGRGIGHEDRRKIGALGLLGMSERVASLNGNMQIQSTLGEGTIVECKIPHSVNPHDAEN